MIARKIAKMHQMFGLKPGYTCGDCVNLACGQFGSRIRYKCIVYGWTHSEASDWTKSWPACKMFGHEYIGRPVIELQKDPETPMDGQMDLLGEGPE